MLSLIWLVVIGLIVFWLVGMAFRIAGKFIHLALLLAAALVIYNWITTGHPGL